MNKILGIIVAVVVLAGVGIFLFTRTMNQDVQTQTETTTPTSTPDEKGSQGAAPLFEAVIAKAPFIELKDVSNSGATGTAWLAVSGGKTYHRVLAKNMPALPGADFYEGWLVKNPATGEFFSSGKMAYDPVTKEARLDFIMDGDQSDFRFVVITSEPDDNNPAPDKHIIEERFAATTDLNVDLTTSTPQQPAQKKGTYEAYRAESITLAETNDVILFFHASWCPTCRALNADIEANSNMIPDGVIILKTNYDTETELKKKYGVTYQHTLVQVDRNGNLIKKWSGGSTLQSILSQVQ